MAPYEASVVRALRDVARSSRDRIPLWMPGLLNRIPARVSSILPLEVVCVLRVGMTHDMMRYEKKLNVQVLAQRGWSKELSFAAYKNFRFVHPALRFPVEAFRVMPRASLVDEYGHTFGNLLADVCVDPDSQPYFHALLTGDLTTQRWRPMLDALLQYDMTMLDQIVTPNGSLPSGFVETVMYRNGPADLYDAGTTPRTLGHAEATEMFYDATGFTPDFTFDISPQEMDYEALAEAGTPVWKANTG